MTRQKRCRKVEYPPKLKGLRPLGCKCPKSEIVTLLIDEYEAIRLMDFENLSQDEAARRMQVSRPTFTRIYDSARKTIAQSIVGGKELVIGEGAVEFYGVWHSNINIKNTTDMNKIAIPSDNDVLFQHFGKAKQFTFVSIMNDKTIKKEVINAPLHEHGSIPFFIMANNANTVIAGGIGAKPVQMLTDAGLDVHIGVPSLPIDEIISKYIEGNLTFNSFNPYEGYHYQGGRTNTNSAGFGRGKGFGNANGINFNQNKNYSNIE